MPRKKIEPTQTVDEIVAQAVAARDGNERRRIAAKARSLGHELVKKPKKLGRPTRYSQSMADKINSMVAEGKTLTKISNELGLALPDVYHWMESHEEFFIAYQKARRSMCVSLVDNMLDQMESTEKEEALLLKVKAGICQWVASRYNSEQFSDKRTLQVNGAVEHRHTHQLTVDQKRRIAESWLLSKSDKPLIEAQTTGPDLPVQTVSDEEQREIPRRKAMEAPRRKPRNPPGATTKRRDRSQAEFDSD